ncbi:SIP domain-containing protein [Agromyces sp. LHK192]|uniref:SIP domain-containing protein n=1 Tax=Agromyces sp. LHK192 TaxID=2498704 RepID=UPI000FDAD3C5|nr:SIP domain-containing protein [Agromyces sp. LHK192]
MQHHQAHFLLLGGTEDLGAIADATSRFPVDAYGQVFIEVASLIQVVDLPVPPHVSVTWLQRDLAPGSIAPRGRRAAQALRAWVSEWLPEEAAAVPYVLWIGCAASEEIDELYRELGERLPRLHLHHPHH